MSMTGDYLGDSVGTAALQALAAAHQQHVQSALAAQQLAQQVALYQQQQAAELAQYQAKSNIDQQGDLAKINAQSAANQKDYEAKQQFDQTHGNLIDFMAKHAGTTFQSMPDLIQGFKAAYPNDAYAQTLTPEMFPQGVFEGIRHARAMEAIGQENADTGYQTMLNNSPEAKLPYESALQRLRDAGAMARVELQTGAQRDVAAGVQAGANQRADLQARTSTENNIRTNRTSSENSQRSAATSLLAHQGSGGLTAASLLHQPAVTFLSGADQSKLKQNQAFLQTQSHHLAAADGFYNKAQAEQAQMIVNNLMANAQGMKQKAIHDAEIAGPVTGISFTIPRGFPRITNTPGLPILPPASPGAVDVARGDGLGGVRPYRLQPTPPPKGKRKTRTLQGGYGGTVR